MNKLLVGLAIGSFLLVFGSVNGQVTSVSFEEMLQQYDSLVRLDQRETDSLEIKKLEIDSMFLELEKNRLRSHLKIASLRAENEQLQKLMEYYQQQPAKKED